MESIIIYVIIMAPIIIIGLVIFTVIMKYTKKEIIELGSPNKEMICPHCQTKGKIRVKQVTQKQGISGAKATGAIFTAGLSLFVTGLSRKQEVTEAHCEFCNSTWHFA